jgi:Xaa-Pro aminopeptidase
VRQRLERLVERTAAQPLDAYVFFLDPYVAYLSGFTFVPTERPIVYVGTADESLLVVPFLEGEHARQGGNVDEVATYEEYPGPRHPMRVLEDLLADRGLDASDRRIGIDVDGYPPLWGYSGPPLRDITSATLVPVAAELDAVMMRKSEYEIARLRQSSRWAGRAHTLLQEYTRVGLRETEVANRASADATGELLLDQPGYRSGSSSSGAKAGYRGQIGRRGALPHSLGANVEFAVGDTLVTGATAPMWGYVSELERTMFLGNPGPEQRTLFGHMKALQDLCLEALRPGTTAAAVDLAMRDYFERNGLWDLWRHHVGHGIGRRYHEAPFLDRGDDTVLEPGMVLTVEPGLYHPDWGGFRHSDTVLITATGAELLTAYPRDLADLILPVE